MARIAVIVGSVRRDRKGIGVARWIERKLEERNHNVYFIHPMELDLPLLHRMYKEMENPSKKLVELRDKIKNAEGYIPVTPEYNRSTSSAMKNTLDYFLEEYYFKPSSIKFPFSSNTLCTLGIANDEGIDGEPISANISLSCCVALIPPNMPGE